MQNMCYVFLKKRNIFTDINIRAYFRKIYSRGTHRIRTNFVCERRELSVEECFLI